MDVNMSNQSSCPLALCPWCKKYLAMCPLDTKIGDGYSIASCSNPSCEGTVLMCSQCPKIYKRSKNSGKPYRIISEHITKCHNAVDDSDSDYDTDDDCPQLSKRDEDDSDDESETGANDSNIHDVLEPENYYDCNDFDDDNECGLPEYSFEDHIDFKNDVSNAFFRQDYDMYHTHEELFGGFRGLCWRARHCQQLYDRENIASINHAKFMFYMTSLIEDNTTSTNQKLFNIFNEIHNLTGHALKNSDIVVPTNSIMVNMEFSIIFHVLRYMTSKVMCASGLMT